MSEAEISNFSFICFLVEPYVKNIEAGKLMVPFIYTELKGLPKKPSALYLVKPDVLNKCKTGLQIASIDLDLKENLVPFSDVK